MDNLKIKYLVSCMIILGSIVIFPSDKLLMSVNAQKTSAPSPTEAGKIQQAKTTLTLVTTLFGVNSTTGKVVVFATINGSTEGRILNATQADLLDKQKDGIVEVGLTLPNATISSGDKFRACVIVLNSLQSLCSIGHKSASNRAEFIDLILNEIHGTLQHLSTSTTKTKK